MTIANARPVRLAGFHIRITRWLIKAGGSPAALLGLVVAVAGVLSAILTNEIVCLAMAPVRTIYLAALQAQPLAHWQRGLHAQLSPQAQRCAAAFAQPQEDLLQRHSFWFCSSMASFSPSGRAQLRALGQRTQHAHRHYTQHDVGPPFSFADCRANVILRAS